MPKVAIGGRAWKTLVKEAENRECISFWVVFALFAQLDTFVDLLSPLLLAFKPFLRADFGVVS